MNQNDNEIPNLHFVPVSAPVWLYRWNETEQHLTAEAVAAWRVTEHPEGVTLDPLLPGFTHHVDPPIPVVLIGDPTASRLRVALTRVLPREIGDTQTDLEETYCTTERADGAWHTDLPESDPLQEVAREVVDYLRKLRALLADVEAGAPVERLPISPELRLMLASTPIGSAAAAAPVSRPRKGQTSTPSRST